MYQIPVFNAINTIVTDMECNIGNYYKNVDPRTHARTHTHTHTHTWIAPCEHVLVESTKQNEYYLIYTIVLYYICTCILIFRVMTFYLKPLLSIIIYNHYFSGWLEDLSNKPRLKNGSKLHNNFMFKSLFCRGCRGHQGVFIKISSTFCR